MASLKNDQNPPSKPDAEAYNRVLTRVEKGLDTLEERTWSAVQKVIKEAVEFELDLSEFTKEEVSLLNAYVARDLKSLYHYMQETGQGVKEWLKMDVELIEDRILDRLFAIADKTRVEQVVLEQKLAHHPGDYIAGEVATAGMLQCVNCGAMVCLVDTAEIEPCHDCDALYFHRVTSRWPPDDESTEEGDNEQ